MESYDKYVGLVFDNRYCIERVIGIGGMAVVFKATDILMRREVAVKILKDEISEDKQAVKRFINESKAVAMLSHQNIVNIYDVSVRDDVKYIVMEYVEGITLKSYIEHRHVLNFREITSYTSQMLKALSHAHKKGVVHRDIKPQNIMLLKNGIIKVTDFGIAKIPNADTLTMTDKAIGTVFYISPEQASGTEIDARSDLYSLGIMMYEMATGSLPFTAESPVSVALMQVNDAPTPPRELNPKIPVGLEQIILKAMEKDPADRYQTADEMLEQITKLRENPRIVFKEKGKSKKQTTRNSASSSKNSGEDSHKTSKSMFPIIMGVTLAFLIAAGIAGYHIFDRLFLNNALNDYKNLTVDNFLNVTYTDELEEWFRSSSYYNVPEIIYVYSDQPNGVIVDQDPNPDEVRKVLPGKQKCNLKLEVSRGVRQITVEDYSVCDYRTAETAIRKLGLKVKIEYEENAILEIGSVIRTDPEAGSIVKENDTITLYVSKGKDIIKVMMPNLVGLNEAQALARIIESNLEVGKITYVKSDTIAGLVVEQDCTPWYEVTAYTAVNISVSGGPYYTGDGTSVPTAEEMAKKEDPKKTEPDDDNKTEDTQAENGGEDDWFED